MKKSILIMKKILALTFLFFLFLIVACGRENAVVFDSGKNGVHVNIEIADTFDERQSGLMFRDHLDENDGMLFIFDEEGYYPFWMKNTLIPLDMIWISEDLRVVDILHANPCKQDPCKSYKPSGNAKYVVEVNQNFTTKNNINIGDKLRILR